MASLFFFAVGMIVAGRWQDKAGPKKVALFGGVLLAIGAGLAGVLYKTVGGLVFAYGILGGLGVGFAYVTPIATCIKWFPDMRGTITGLAVFGFGAGTLVFGPLISKLIASSGIANAFFAVGSDHAGRRLRRGLHVQGPARRVQAGRLEPADAVDAPPRPRPTGLPTRSSGTASSGFCGSSTSSARRRAS